MNDYGTMSGLGMGFGWIIPVVFIFTLIYLINYLLKSDSSATEILDKKYANGELNEREYRVKKEALRS